MRIVDLEQGSPEWLEYRSRGIGASDVAAIAKLNPFKKPEDVYLEKKGLKTPFVNDAMRAGLEREPIVRSYMQEKLGIELKPLVVEHDEFPYFFASLDAANIEAEELIEIKCPTNSTLFDMAKCKTIPAHYEAQCQWQLYITGLSHMTYAVMYDDEIATVEVKRNDDFIDELVNAAQEFSNSLVLDKMPDPKFTPLELQHDYFLFQEYKDMVLEKKRFDARLKELKEEILELSNLDCWTAHGLRIQKQNGSKSYDIEAMKRDGIDVEKYAKEGNSFYRINLIKETKND